MPEEEYAKILRSSGYGEPFINAELERLREYKDGIATPAPESVIEGPTVTPQYEAWARRRRQQATEEGKKHDKSI